MILKQVRALKILWRACETLNLRTRVVDSVRRGWALRVCISTKFPGKADAAVPGTAL